MATAQDIMVKNLLTLKDNCSAKDAIKLILDKRISGIPIVSDDMTLLGIVTEKDLLQLSFYDSADEVTVGDIMTRDVVSMDEKTDLLEISEFFLNNNYKRLPITSSKKLVGIISRKDMLKYILNK
ncbi:MAG: CBS domain-containing protein [Spirochaetes bacterium]|nr:CBS domain-containing protein [Spirochaetota bacterium]